MSTDEADMNRLPHNMAVITDAYNRCPPVLILGAGLSIPLVPNPKQLLDEYKDTAEESLGCSPFEVNQDDENALYEWADGILDQLPDDEMPPKKLRLAKHLGLMTDPRWRAKVGVCLRGSEPRHRVIARFAREGIWVQIWSLNWDFILESAFECVGLMRGNGSRTQPWPTCYDTTITADQMRGQSETHIISIVKPHGCVQSLIDAEQAVESGDDDRAKKLSNRFMIGQKELTDRSCRQNEADDAFFDELRTQLRHHPLVIVGWSASEETLRKAAEEAAGTRNLSPNIDELTIIDPDFNAYGHTILAQQYCLTEEQVHVAVSSGDDGLTTDLLFLGMQAQYILDVIYRCAPSAWQPTIDRKKQMLADLESANARFLLEWADNFLPSWVRLCWRGEIIGCPGFQPNQLRLEKPDEHIPLRNLATTRNDLKAAAYLLHLLPDDGGDWDVSTYHGAIWNEASGRLLIPLPAWGTLNSLAAIELLMTKIETNNPQGAAFINSMEIVPLLCDPEATVTPEIEQQLKDKIAPMSRMAKFADPDNWQIRTTIE